MALVDTRLRRVAVVALLLALIALPAVASGFVLDLAAQAALAAIGALALNLLTGFAGQVSLGHAASWPPARSPRRSSSRSTGARRRDAAGAALVGAALGLASASRR
jgi:hypothetical protein